MVQRSLLEPFTGLLEHFKFSTTLCCIRIYICNNSVETFSQINFQRSKICCKLEREKYGVRQKSFIDRIPSLGIGANYYDQ